MGRLSYKDLQVRRDLAAAIIAPMLTGKRDRKVAGTYKRLTPGKDGMIHTSLSPDTASNRLSSNESPWFPASTNIQNLEQKVAKLDPYYQVRDIVIPKPGMVFLAGDYKGAEALLRGAYSKDWDFVEKLIAGADVHTDLAAFLFGIAPEQVTRLQRDIAKTIAYATQYNAKVPTITLNLNKEADATGYYFSQQEVADLRARLLLKHPLEAWWAETRRELDESNGILRNCFGYRRTFYDPDPDERLKDGLSFYPQSTVGSLMNRALPIFYATIDEPDVVELIHQNHDEALFQCLPEEVNSVISVCTPVMEHRFTIHGRELYIPVDWKVGQSWGGMKAVAPVTH